MKVKRLLLLILIASLCFSAFAEDTYAIKVVSADEMQVNDSIVVLTGNVKLSINTASEKNSSVDRSLTAQKVVFNLDEKLLQASGLVHLEEGEDSSFDGEVLSLNWDTLDVVVFDGGSSTERHNAQGNPVNFSTSGQRVSYEGETDSVFFENGVVATRPKDPYWSFRAKEIAMANTDLFFKNATFRMGRVPMLWFPFFFYPGSRLSINPAMGIKSDRGVFLNTTYEVYGVYPKIGGSSSDFEDDSAAAAFFALLQDNDDNETIRDGYVYRNVKSDEKFPPIEEWARRTGSYLALFGDAYEETGIALGYDTKNVTEDSSISLESTGVLGFRAEPLIPDYNKFRYAFDLNYSMNISNMNMSLNVPLYSDPSVKSDFLNRNTVFGLDSVFGVNQVFPSNYDYTDEYELSLNASSHHKIGKYTFNINSINSKINYKWNDKESKFDVSNATLPYISVSTGGTIFSLNKSYSKTVDKTYSNVARKYKDEYSALDLTDAQTVTYTSEGNIVPVKAQSTERTVSDSAYLKMGFSYSQTVDNNYASEFKHTAFNTNVYTSVDLSGRTRGGLFSFNEVIQPVFSGKYTEGTFNTTNFKVTSSLSASVPVLGISYNLAQNIYVKDNKDGAKTSRYGKWNKDDISSHSISFSKSFGPVGVSVSQTLKPLTENLNPSISYSRNGFSASYSTNFVHDDSYFEQNTSNFGIGLSNKYFSFSFSNSIDHKKDGMEGYTGSQSLSFGLFNRRVSFSESMGLEKEFDVTKLSLGASYRNLNCQFNFTGNDLEKESFNVSYRYNIQPIYFWKNRIGVESVMSTGLNYNYINSFNSSFYINFDMNFAVSKFIDLQLSVKSVNNAFYNYLDENNKFVFKDMFKDLAKSFDFFGDGRKQTNFKLSALSLSAVHYMEDWNLTVTAGQSVQTNSKGKKEFRPEVSVMIQWNAIPELKVKSKWDPESKWREN